MKNQKPASPATLRRRLTKTLQALPPLTEVMRGSLLRRLTRCGKPSCRCAQGPGHALVYVTVTFAGGRTQQVTVPPALEPVVRQWIRNYQRYGRAIEEASALNRRLLQLRQISDRAASPPPDGASTDQASAPRTRR